MQKYSEYDYQNNDNTKSDKTKKIDKKNNCFFNNSEKLKKDLETILNDIKKANGIKIYFPIFFNYY